MTDSFVFYVEAATQIEVEATATIYAAPEFSVLLQVRCRLTGWVVVNGCLQLSMVVWVADWLVSISVARTLCLGWTRTHSPVFMNPNAIAAI